MGNFSFKQFTIEQDLCAMKVGTDGVLLGAWAVGGDRVLDVGTGTGVIALMMAQRYPEAHITAIDVDERAVRQARENVARAGREDRIEVMRLAVQALGYDDDYHGMFDAVVSNPPFFVDALKSPDDQRNLARHADKLPYGELMEAAWHLLTDEGVLSVVVPFDYVQKMEDEATFRGFFLRRKCAVRTGEDKNVRRYLLAFRKRPCRCQRSEMTIGDETYRQLTQDFYL
jgi:tRNA1Val (adenine37-N6)-methyltransferase